jgi:hypothetical protein
VSKPDIRRCLVDFGATSSCARGQGPCCKCCFQPSGDDSAAIVDGVVITERTLKNRIISTFGDGFDSTSSFSMRSATLKSLIMEQVIDAIFSARWMGMSALFAMNLILLSANFITNV